MRQRSYSFSRSSAAEVLEASNSDTDDSSFKATDKKPAEAIASDGSSKKSKKFDRT